MSQITPDPRTLPPPLPPNQPNAFGPEPDPEPDRHRRSAVAAWVGAVGGLLVLVAGALVVVANWDTIGRSARVGGLALAVVALLAASERLRRVVPTSASIIAHVGTFLTGATGIAVMSLVGVTWPGCLAVGGAVAIVATEWQARRWRHSTFRAGQVVAICLAATGMGELTGTTGGLVAAIVAVLLLAAGATRRSAALALLAVCSPALVALADVGIGAGTFERAGLVGERLSWSGPVVGVLAAMVLAIAATRRRSNPLMVTAAVAPVVGVVTGLAAVDGSAIAWASVPAFALIAVELGWWMLPSDRLRRPITASVDAVAAAVAVAAWWSPLLGLARPSVADDPRAWAVPIAVTLLAVALATFRWRATDRRLEDVGLAALATTALGVAAAIGLADGWVAAVAVVAGAGAVYGSRRLHPVPVHVPAAWSLLVIGRLAAGGGVGTVALAAVLGVVALAAVVAARARLAAERPFGSVEMSLVLAGFSVCGTAFAGDHPATAALVAAGLVAVAIMGVADRFVGRMWAMLLPVGVLAAVVAPVTGELATLWVGVAALAVAFGTAGVIHRSRTAASFAASLATVALALSTVAVGVTAVEFLVLAIVAMATSSGLVAALGRRSPLDAVAVTSGALVVVGTMLDVAPDWVSIGWLALGAQVLAAGLVLRDRLVAGTGAAVAACAATSWWFTSGLHEAVADLLEPLDVTATDGWLALATATSFVGAIVIRRHATASSWVTHGATLVVATLWLVPVQIDRDTVWAMPLSLAIGLAAVVAGGWRRLAAPLVGGTALTVVTVFVATGSDLRAVPAWAWIALGGVTLLAAGAVIERRNDDQETSLRDLVRGWE